MATKQGPDDGEEYERKSNITADISNIYHELNALCVKLDTAKDDLQKGQQKNVDLQADRDFLQGCRDILQIDRDALQTALNELHADLKDSQRLVASKEAQRQALEDAAATKAREKSVLVLLTQNGHAMKMYHEKTEVTVESILTKYAEETDQVDDMPLLRVKAKDLRVRKRDVLEAKVNAHVELSYVMVPEARKNGVQPFHAYEVMKEAEPKKKRKIT